jgi:hypothetical protein
MYFRLQSRNGQQIKSYASLSLSKKETLVSIISQNKYACASAAVRLNIQEEQLFSKKKQPYAQAVSWRSIYDVDDTKGGVIHMCIS